VVSLLLAAPAAAQGAERAAILTRVEPKTYDLSCMVSFFEDFPGDATRIPSVEDRQRLVRGEFFFPVIVKGSHHAVLEETVTLRAFASSIEVPIERARRDEGPFDTSYAAGILPPMSPVGMRWQVLYRVRVSNVVFDETAAQQVTWPREWPDDVEDGLGPSFGVASDDPLFKETVERVSLGRVREVTPHIAAKELVRYAVENIRVLEPKVAMMRPVDISDPDTGNTQRGLQMRMEDDLNRSLMLTGALHAARSGVGTPADLVAVSVALLRAAEIPARPVIGITDEGEKDEHFICWGEYYLHDVGWIPFDPMDMQSRSMAHLNAADPYPGFGGVRDLNERIPFAYEFVPATSAKPQLFALPYGLPETARRVTNPYAVNAQRTFFGGWGHNMLPLESFNAFFYPKVRIEIRPVRE